MEHTLVHGSPHEFTRADSDLLIRSLETAMVQVGSPRTVTSLVTGMTPSPSGSNTVSLSGISCPADPRARITGPLEYGSGGPGGVLTWACELTRSPLNPGDLQLRAAALPTRGAWNAPASRVLTRGRRLPQERCRWKGDASRRGLTPVLCSLRRRPVHTGSGIPHSQRTPTGQCSLGHVAARLVWCPVPAERPPRGTRRQADDRHG